MTIVLHQFKPLYGMPSASPFGCKLEAYLRMAGLAYETEIIRGRPRSPTGKGPYLTIDGQLLYDTGLIIDYLERANGHPVEGHMTLAQRAESLALQRLMEEHLYWVAVYARWLDPGNPRRTRGYIRDVLGLPAPLAFFVAPLLQRRVRRALHGQGLGRLAPEVIWKMGAADIQALAHWLGNRPFGFNDKPTVFDAVLFAAVGTITSTPWDFPLKAVTVKHGNLMSHFARMRGKYFPGPAAD